MVRLTYQCPLLSSDNSVCFYNKMNCACYSCLIILKGRDDLRQDAVMQQVFQMCNTLLQRNTETRKRKLTICTYKVTSSYSVASPRKDLIAWTSDQKVFSVKDQVVNSKYFRFFESCRSLSHIFSFLLSAKSERPFLATGCTKTIDAHCALKSIDCQPLSQKISFFNFLF